MLLQEATQSSLRIFILGLVLGSDSNPKEILPSTGTHHWVSKYSKFRRKEGKVPVRQKNFQEIFYFLYSTLLHLPPLRFHCVIGWEGTQHPRSTWSPWQWGRRLCRQLRGWWATSGRGPSERKISCISGTYQKQETISLQRENMSLFPQSFAWGFCMIPHRYAKNLLNIFLNIIFNSWS